MKYDLEQNKLKTEFDTKIAEINSTMKEKELKSNEILKNIEINLEKHKMDFEKIKLEIENSNKQRTE